MVLLFTAAQVNNLYINLENINLTSLPNAHNKVGSCAKVPLICCWLVDVVGGSN